MLALVHESPVSLVLIAYAALAAGLGLAAWRLSKAWLRVVADHNKTDLHDVLAASLPRPIGAAVSLFVIDTGLHWFPVPDALETMGHRWMRFGLGIFIVLTLARVARKAIDAYGRSNPELRSSSGLGKAIIWVIGLSATALLASDALGISLAPALTALGVGSLAVALALQDTLSNFFSGIYLLVDKPVRPGEFIRIESGPEGYVEAIGWRATLLRTLAPSVVIVPNATLAKSVLTNFRGNNPRLSIDLRVDVALGSDRDKVEELLILIAKGAVDVPGVRKEPAPLVRFNPGASDRGLGFTVSYALESTADGGLVQSELRKRIFARLVSEKIALPSPPFPGTSSTSSSSAS
jgi:small-conductance mechanosensitive channel